MLDLTPILGTYDYTIGTLDAPYIVKAAILIIFIWIVGVCFINLLKGLLR